MNFKGYQVLEAKSNQVDLFFDHMERQVAENGQGDTPIYTALTKETFKRNPEEVVKRWQRNVSEKGWVRNWVAIIDGQIIGNIQLNGSARAAEMHRVALSIGIESKHRGIGLGGHFMDVALAWVKDNGFVWIDLEVYENNERAIQYYKKYGFEQNGFTKDLCRVFGKSMDCISMTKFVGAKSK